MVDIPPLAGWPEEYPEKKPFVAVVLLQQDLEELSGNPKVIDSEAWLHKFAKNALSLKKRLDFEKHTHDVDLLDMRNWFENTLIKGASLNLVLDAYNASDFKEIGPLQTFLKGLIEKNYSSLESLHFHLKRYLSS